MKKVILNIITLTIICAGITMNSCTKLEDKNYTDIISTQFVPTANDVGALFGAAYGSWREVICPSNWDEGLWLASEVCTDQLCIAIKPFGWDDGHRHIRMHQHKWVVDDSYVTGLWSPPYQGITNCNRLILQTDELPIDDDAKAHMKAELRVLRASFYWVLCDCFGNVPIVDRFDVPSGFLPEQSTRKQVYDFIVKEITESIPYLSEDADQTTYGRFNSKWPAFALLAKVYLNAKVYSGTPQWDKCISACDSVILSGKYALEAIQKNNFLEQNQNSREIIFSVPYDEIYTPDLMVMFYYSLPLQAQTMWNLQNQPWGGITAIPQFMNSYHPDDLRGKADWIIGQQYSSDGQMIYNTSGNMAPFNCMNNTPGIDSMQENNGYYLNKYEKRTGGMIGDAIMNDFVIFRYADILLMKAECLTRLGRPGAGAIVTQVRERSFLTNPSAATVTDAQLSGGSLYDYGLRNYHTSTSEGGADIQYGRMLDELGWEFVGEGLHRRQDMIRFGVFTTKSWFSHSSENDINKTLFPIPLNELNKNSHLHQNTGY